MGKIERNFGFTTDGDDMEKIENKAREAGRATQFSATEASDAMYYMRVCKGVVNDARMTAGDNDGGSTVVAITGHESDAKDVSDSFVDFSIHFVIKTDSDNVLKVQDRLIKDIDILLREKYGLDDYVEVNDDMVKGFEGDYNE